MVRVKNTHIDHPEDSILLGDLSVLDWFTAQSHLSTKIDGAPAIVWGTNPATGRFFVGTKSVFNKVKIKINETHDDIEKNHGHTPTVANILHNCLSYLPRTSSIYQGDFIGFGKGKTEYKPNTITYKFKKPVFAQLIIAPHTEYFCSPDHKDLRNCYSEPLTHDLEKFGDNVVWVRPNAYLMQDDFDNSIAFAKQMATLCNFVETEKHATRIKKFINTMIKNGTNLRAYFFEEDIATVTDCDPNLIRLWLLVKSIKDDMLQLTHNDGPDAYIGEEKIDAEGYVMTNEFGTYKLINREQFSRANFTMEKNWT